jgi:hypothetical protein
MTQPATIRDIVCTVAPLSDLRVESLRRKQFVAGAQHIPRQYAWRTTQRFLDVFDLESLAQLREMVSGGVITKDPSVAIEMAVARLRQLACTNPVARPGAQIRSAHPESFEP